MPHERKGPPMAPLLALLFLGLAAALFFALFEIKPTPAKKQLSAKAKRNNVLALQYWLEAENKEVRDERPVENMTILSFEEDFFIVDALSLDPQGLMLADLLAMARRGNSLLLHSLKPEGLSEMNTMLVESTGARLFDNEEDPEITITADETLNQTAYGTDANSLWFDNALRIDSATGHNALRLWTDEDSIPRIAEFSLGKGRIIVCGTPFFMQNHFIEDEPNALLTWDLVGRGEHFLFIRSTPSSPAPFGALFEKGNLYFFLTALALLVISGFWMQLAPFGRALPDTDDHEGTSFARWAHEGRFLRRYHSLDSLIEPWRRHLMRRIQTGSPESSLEEAAKKTAAETGLASESVLDLFTGPPTDSMRSFRQRMHTIHALVEKT